MEVKYPKSAARLLNRVYVNRKALDLSVEVLWVSVSQRAAELKAINIEKSDFCSQENDFRIPKQADEVIFSGESFTKS